MNEDLRLLEKFVKEANTTNSVNEKIEIIKKYPELRKMFRYVYDEQIQFGVTGKNVMKKGICDKSRFTDIYDLLDALASRELTGHDALGQVNGFIEANGLAVADPYGFANLIYGIIDKDLKTRTDSSLINKALPNCVPTFDVALAHVYEDHIKKVNFEEGTWWASRKMDGLRLITIVDSNSNARFFSRTGKEFFTLSKLGSEIKAAGVIDIVFDGELCMIDSDGKETFKGIVKQARQKDHTIENPMYMIFDCLGPDEFWAKKSDRDFVERYHTLHSFMGGKSFKYIKKVEQTRVKSNAHFKELRKNALANQWEGLVIRKNVGYEGKRTNNLLKAKYFKDAELTVKAIVTGPFRTTSKVTGLEETIDTLSAVTVDYKGFEVNVGSGFSLDERKEFYANPELIVGKIINVRYFGETTNDKGTLSLQFPTYCWLYGDERDV